MSTKGTVHLSSDFETPLSRAIRFWILLPCCILSVSCCVLLLYYFITIRKLRRGLHNHVVIVLIVLELLYLVTDVPLYLNYLRLGYVWPQTPSICLFWWVFSDGVHETITVLVAWASIERHILIFNTFWASTRRKRMLSHYLPIGLILLYGCLFYGVAIFFPPCAHSFQYTDAWCSSFCLYENSSFATYQLVINEILFTVLIGLFSVALVFRVILRKHIRLRQPIQWRKHRKMTIQLIAIASNYLLFHLVDMIILITKPFDLNSDFGLTFEIYISFVNYFAELVLPFICLAALYPKPWRRQRRSVGADTKLQAAHSVRRIHA